MKKLMWALVAVLVVVGAWGVAVFVTGQRMEKQYYAMLNEVSAQGGGLSLASKDYRRGFLRSRAVTEVRLDLPPIEEIAGGAVRFEIAHELRHGLLPAMRTVDGRRQWLPVLAIVESRLAEGDVNKDLLQKAPELARAWSCAVIDFRGGSENRFDIPGFRREFDEGTGSFAWGGLTGEVIASDDLGKLRGTFRLPKVEFTLSGAGVRVEEANADFAVEKAFDALYLGEGKSHIRHLVVQFPDEDPLDFADLQLTADSRQEGHLVEYGEVIELKSLTAGDRALGSGRLDLQIRNINGPALAKFYADAQAAQKKGGAEEEAAAAMQQAVFELIGGLSTDAPQIEIRQLQVTTPQGRLDGHALLRLTGKEKLTMENIASAFGRLQAEAEVKVSRQLALDYLASTLRDGEESGTVIPAETAARKKAEEQLAAWIGENLLVPDGDNLKMTALFRDGEFTINGKPFGGM